MRYLAVMKLIKPLHANSAALLLLVKLQNTGNAVAEVYIRARKRQLVARFFQTKYYFNRIYGIKPSQSNKLIIFRCSTTLKKQLWRRPHAAVVTK